MKSSNVIENYININVDNLVRSLKLITSKEKSKSENKQYLKNLLENYTLIFKQNNEYYKQNLSFSFVKTQFNGIRIYFYCENCERYVRNLYSPNPATSTFLCRHCWNLGYIQQKRHKTAHESLANYLRINNKLTNYQHYITNCFKRISSKRLKRLILLNETSKEFQNNAIKCLEVINNKTLIQSFTS